MNSSKPFTVKNVLLLLLAFSVIYFQVNTSQKLVNVENQLSMMRNDINSVSGLVSQQNNLVSEEKADYRFYGLTFENEILNSKVGILTMKMNLSFTKLPADAKVFIDYQGSLDHYPPMNGEPSTSLEIANKDMTYDKAQSAEFRLDGLNQYTSEMVFATGKNYQLTLVVKTPTDTFSEPLGVIPALEWSEPAYYGTVEILNLSSDSRKGNFEYRLALVTLNEMNNGFGFYDTKILYDFKKLSEGNNPGVTDIVKATYKISLKDQAIKEGDLVPYFNSELGTDGWEIKDAVAFDVAPSSDYASDLQIEFKLEDKNGKVRTITRGVF